MAYNILIFVQAPADLRHALSVYKKNEGATIHICVVNVQSVYKFLQSLPLVNTQIDFYPSILLNFKSPFSIFKARKKIKKIWKQDFEINTYEDVYFFSRFYDWFTFGMVIRLLNKIKKTIYYYDHYDYAVVQGDIKLNKCSITYLKKRIVNFILEYVSGAKFSTYYKQNSINFDYGKYPIIKLNIEEEPLVDERFLYKLNLKAKNVLLFLSPIELELITDQAKKELEDIIDLLKQNSYYTLLKGHPRLGVPQILDEKVDVVIPNYIPSEFLSYDNVNLVIGIISTALNYASLVSERNVISLIDILEFRDKHQQKSDKEYLKTLSKNRIKFVRDLGELAEYLQERLK